jgi:NAD(P)-dependent dehydrogenase (short-subunit alcohol dehydrogenase family)
MIQESAYATNRGAIRVFSKVKATERANDNIRRNSARPGLVYMEMFRATFATVEALAEHLSWVPMKRAGVIDESISGLLYLAADE